MPQTQARKAGKGPNGPMRLEGIKLDDLVGVISVEARKAAEQVLNEFRGAKGSLLGDMPRDGWNQVAVPHPLRAESFKGPSFQGVQGAPSFVMPPPPPPNPTEGR